VVAVRNEPNEAMMPWLKSRNEDVLKEYPNLRDFLPYLDGLNEESPRGQVLISTGYMEQLLEDILRAFMLEIKTVDDLFKGGNAPIGTFSAKMKSAYALGLISEDEFHDFELIRRIRNYFAHSMTASFDEQEVKSRCKELRHKAHDYGEVVMDPLAQFTSAASGMLLNLVNRAHYIWPEARDLWKLEAIESPHANHLSTQGAWGHARLEYAGLGQVSDCELRHPIR
jgi:mannitol operon repressor